MRTDTVALQKVTQQNVGVPQQNIVSHDQPQPTSIYRQNQPITYQSANKTPVSNIFGSEFFTSTSLSFEPNLRISTPTNYVLGPDDELLVNIFGKSLANWNLFVTPEGNINLPGIGVINIAGMTVEKATAVIRSKLIENKYSIGNGTSISVTLGKIRSIRVTVIGAAKPGNYTVSSLSTVFNSLFLCGGPGSINSYRDIELIRGGKVYQKIDIYQFLTHGDQKGNVLLKEGDIINFPVYKKLVDITGEVNRPNKFELKDGENFENLLFFAGGFSAKAFKATIKVKQVTDTERKIKDLSKHEIMSYKPANGDSFKVDAILDRVENAIKISGAVYRPGEFELTPGTTISSLIKRAGGLMENAFTERALLTRTLVDGKTENIPFDVTTVMSGGANDITLIKSDVISISTLNQFVTPYTVTIWGEVRNPGTLPYRDNLTLKDVLFTVNGFTDAASLYNVEVSRRIQKNSTIGFADSIAIIYTLNVSNSFTMDNDRFTLKPFDIITVRRNPGYVEQKQVTINGEVNFPGPYIIKSKNERVSDVLKRAGGLTPFAHIKGIYIIRKSINENIDQQREIVRDMQIALKDTSKKAFADIAKPNVRIPINFEKIEKKPNIAENYTLQDDDIIEVLKFEPLVKIGGEVLMSTQTGYVENKPLGYYITQAGGTSLNARKSKIYVLYADGHVKRTKNGFFGVFRSYPKIEAGSEIIVPRKHEARKLTIGEMLGISSGIVSITTLVIVALSALGK